MCARGKGPGVAPRPAGRGRTGGRPSRWGGIALSRRIGRKEAPERHRNVAAGVDAEAPGRPSGVVSSMDKAAGASGGRPPWTRPRNGLGQVVSLGEAPRGRPVEDVAPEEAAEREKGKPRLRGRRGRDGRAGPPPPRTRRCGGARRSSARTIAGRRGARGAVAAAGRRGPRDGRRARGRRLHGRGGPDARRVASFHGGAGGGAADEAAWVKGGGEGARAREQEAAAGEAAERLPRRRRLCGGGCADGLRACHFG